MIYNASGNIVKIKRNEEEQKGRGAEGGGGGEERKKRRKRNEQWHDTVRFIPSIKSCR